MPLLTFGAMFLIARFTANNETDLSDFNRIGVVDRAGIVTVLENPDASAGSDEPEYVLLTNPDEPVPGEDDPEARAH